MLRAMEAAGCSAEQIVATLQFISDKREDNRRDRTAKRTRAWRTRVTLQQRHRDARDASQASQASQASHPTKSKPYDVSRDASHASPRARVEDNLLTKVDTGKKNNRDIDDIDDASRASRRPRAIEVLSEALRPEVAQAVLDHRQRIRRPLTAYAAQLLVKGFNSTADPNAAAETMIARGWQGFKPEWMNEDRRQHDRPKKRSLVDAGLDLIRRVDELYAPKVSPDDGGQVRDPAFRLLPGPRGQ